eukprot:7577_1
MPKSLQSHYMSGQHHVHIIGIDLSFIVWAGNIMYISLLFMAFIECAFAQLRVQNIMNSRSKAHTTMASATGNTYLLFWVIFNLIDMTSWRCILCIECIMCILNHALSI